MQESSVDLDPFVLACSLKSYAPKALVSALAAIWETPGQSLIGDCCTLPADFQIHDPECSRPPLTVLDTQKHTYLQFDWLYHQCCIIATLLISSALPPPSLPPFCTKWPITIWPCLQSSAKCDKHILNCSAQECCWLISTDKLRCTHAATRPEDERHKNDMASESLNKVHFMPLTPNLSVAV